MKLPEATVGGLTQSGLEGGLGIRGYLVGQSASLCRSGRCLRDVGWTDGSSGCEN